MGLLERITFLIKANLNDLIEQCEDPEHSLRELISDMEEDLSYATVQIQQSRTDAARYENQLRHAVREASLWQEKAELSVRQGKDDLARIALTRKRKAVLEAEEAKSAQDEYLQVIRKLQASFEPLQEKLAAAKRELERMIRRQESASVQRNVHSALDGVVTHSTESGLDKLQTNIDEAEAHAETLRELQAGDFESQLSQWKMEDEVRQVEDELEQLKQRLSRK